MKIVRTDKELETPLIDQTLIARGYTLTLLPDGVSETELAKALIDCDLLLMCYTPITRTVLQKASRLKAIIKYGVGIDAIDIEAANEKGIIVVNIPEYAEETVAEGTFTLLLALAKKLTSLHHEMNRNQWAWPTQNWLGFDLAGKTLGIIGCGKIGKSLARMGGQGFRMKVLGYDPYQSREGLAQEGIEKYDQLQAFLRACDFISLHAVLNTETKHLLGKKEFSNMKETAIIVNTARGALIDELALLQALETGRIAGAGIDVFSQEPLNNSNHPLKKLYSMDNVILLPHLTFYTKEAMQRLEEEVLERCAEVIENRPVLIKSKDARLQQQSHLKTTNSRS